MRNEPKLAPVHVRDARPEDAEVIADFNTRMAEETEHRRLDPATILAGVREGLNRPSMCRFFVAELDGRIVGQAMVTYEWSDWRCGVFWWIQSVYVHPDARKCGVFRAIYAHLSAMAHEDPSVCGLRLYVEKDNHRAMATYERLGMKTSGHVVFEEDWSGLAAQ